MIFDVIITLFSVCSLLEMVWRGGEWQEVESNCRFAVESGNRMVVVVVVVVVVVAAVVVVGVSTWVNLLFLLRHSLMVVYAFTFCVRSKELFISQKRHFISGRR